MVHGIVNQDDPNVDKILAGHTGGGELSIRHPSDVMAEDEWYGMESGKFSKPFYGKKRWRREDIVIDFRGSLISIMRLPPFPVWRGHFEGWTGSRLKQLENRLCREDARICLQGAGYVFLDRLCPQ